MEMAMNSTVAKQPIRLAAPHAATTLDVPVVGMHCVACAARIEKALAATPGVQQSGVNFATGRATVAYDPSATNPQELREVVRGQGYDAILPDPSAAGAPDDAAAAALNEEYRRLKR